MKWIAVVIILCCFTTSNGSSQSNDRRNCQSFKYLSNQTKIRAIVPRIVYEQSSSWNNEIYPLFLYFRVSTGIYMMFHFVAIFSFYTYMLSLPPFRPTHEFMSLFEKREQIELKLKQSVALSTDSKTSVITSIDDTKISDEAAKNNSNKVMSEAKTQRSPRVPRATKGYQEDELATQEKFLDGLESATDH